MRALPLVAASLLFAAPAHAAGPPKESAAVGQYVDLTTVALPIVRGGKLVNYVFVQTRVNLSGKADVIKVRTKAPYFRDALVKAAHREDLSDPKDPARVDEAKVKAALVREAGRIAGAGLVASAEVVLQNSQRRRF